MGSCEVWVQCESDDHAAEINRKLQEIIQRETEKKQQALQAIRGQQQLNVNKFILYQNFFYFLRPHHFLVHPPLLILPLLISIVCIPLLLLQQLILK